MADDIKALTKRIDTLEKALKSAEAKIKALADNLTSAKDIEKYVDAIRKESNEKEKALARETDLLRKAALARGKEAQKDAEKMNKEMEKIAKDAAAITDLHVIKARLKAVEVRLDQAIMR